MSCEIQQLGNTEVILRCCFFFPSASSRQCLRDALGFKAAHLLCSLVLAGGSSLPFSAAGVYLECRRNTKFRRKNHVKPAGVVEVDWHIFFWRGERIPWQSLKPAGLISQNSAACVLVWLPLAKSHWLILCQLREWARLSMFIESLG